MAFCFKDSILVFLSSPRFSISDAARQKIDKIKTTHASNDRQKADRKGRKGKEDLVWEIEDQGHPPSGVKRKIVYVFNR